VPGHRRHSDGNAGTAGTDGWAPPPRSRRRTLTAPRQGTSSAGSDSSPSARCRRGAEIVCGLHRRTLLAEMRRRADLKHYDMEDFEREEEEGGKEPPQPSPPQEASPASRRRSLAFGGHRDLLVTIKDATGLRASEVGGRSDPLCICELQGKSETRFETEAVRRTLEPAWDEQHVVHGLEHGDTLLFTVVDAALDKGELLGKASLTYAQIGHQGLETELELTAPKAPRGSRGTLRVQVDILDSSGRPYRRRQSSPEVGHPALRRSLASPQRPCVFQVSEAPLASTWSGPRRTRATVGGRPFAVTWGGPDDAKPQGVHGRRGSHHWM